MLAGYGLQCFHMVFNTFPRNIYLFKVNKVILDITNMSMSVVSFLAHLQTGILWQNNSLLTNDLNGFKSKWMFKLAWSKTQFI